VTVNGKPFTGLFSAMPGATNAIPGFQISLQNV